MEQKTVLTVSGLVKKLGVLEVLKGIDLTAQRGEVVSIIGPSGTGKSTLLRCINFLEKPTCGSIAIGDVVVREPGGSRKDITRLRSRTAMVFQNYNLFRNKTALQNVMEPMTQVQGVPEAEAREEALRILRVIGLEEKKDSYPAHLSGGQQQRVGIGRAMAVKPEVMLFDEPTSSLDPELLGEVLELIRSLAARHTTTMLIVTHEMRFAREVSDRILFMDGGYILQQGSPEDIFGSDNPRVQKFIHRMNT
ncbi:amino acid ABC transporter ATP-binding protein [uncultured Fretibacterium sp.]|uniref:amino acid ABC transporter ATP-binding protein n=1 Tax=uncultured Fretibacterium sp. TaxID=1678694 RepID=UPI00261D6EF3|nr:amino acid ABC transporter ATP-binding protein [uncultured Fretibacterium sp.]